MREHAPPPAGAPSQRRNDWHTIRTLLPYLWDFKGRVAAALGFLTLAKLANVGVPLVMKEIVDSLDPRQAMLVLPFSLLPEFHQSKEKTNHHQAEPALPF